MSVHTYQFLILKYGENLLNACEHGLCLLIPSKGVAQVLNRLDGTPFDDADQRLFEVRNAEFA